MSSLYVAYRGGDARQGVWGPVGRLDFEAGIYRFSYLKGATQLPGFQPFVEMPHLDEVYESEKLFPLFANRLLSPSRPEYEAYLAWGGFDPAQPPDPISLLGVTEGRRQTDGIEVFPHPEADADGNYVSKFFLHGLRWASDEARVIVSKLNHDDPLELRLAPDNPQDPHAVAVYRAYANESLRLGYVPRYLASDVSKLISQCCTVSIVVERMNPDAPLQQRLLCRLVACWPVDFEPCAEDSFDPISKHCSILQLV